ncbi:29322_t:CDS:2, partial [Racocetra persica]
KQSFIPSYLKDAIIEKLQNPNHPLCLPMCFKEYCQISISTDFSVLPKILLYYFEVDIIIDKGETGYIEIGFTKNLNNLNILPGWHSGSMGYHGDDGFKFDESGHYEVYSPLFSTGVTIDIAFEVALNENLFPIVRMRSHGGCVELNLGMKLFKFDIDSYAK